MRGGSLNMTSISIPLSGPRALPTTAAQLSSSLLTRFARWCQSRWCVMNGGHFKVLHTEPDRLALRCVACGHTSPGWSIGSPRLARTVPGDPERLRARRPVVA
jgi:hypothetical protein